MSLAAGPPAGRNPETGLWDVLLNLQAALPIRVSEGKLVYLFCEQIGQIGRSTYAYSITAWPVYRLSAAEDGVYSQGVGTFIVVMHMYVHMLNSALEFKGVVKLSRKRYPGNSHGGWTWRAWVSMRPRPTFVYPCQAPRQSSALGQFNGSTSPKWPRQCSANSASRL